MSARVRDAVRVLLSPGSLTVLGALALALAGTVLAGPFILIDSLVTGGMWALVAAGLALVFGVMNIPNFAQGEFFMAGTLSGYLIFTALKTAVKGGGAIGWAAPILSILAATAVGGLIGAVVDWGIFAPLRRRIREQWVMNTFVVTVGLSVIFINLHQLIWGPDYKGIFRYWDLPPLHILGVPIGFDRFMSFVVGVLAIAGLWALLRFSRAGMAIRAVSQDEAGALMVGIDIARVHRLTFALSSGVAALAGASLLFMFPSYPFVGLKPLYVAWTVVILAGLGDVGGAIVSGFIVALFETVTSYFIGTAWEDVVPFALILLVLLLRPAGLFGRGVRGVWEQ